MRRYLYPIFLVIIVIFAGCSTPKQHIAPDMRIVDVPPLGQDRISELGDTLVRKGRIWTYDGISLENTVTGGGFPFKKLTLRPGNLKATMYDDEWIYYTTEKLEVSDTMIGTLFQMGGLAIRKAADKDIKIHMGAQHLFTPEPKPILKNMQITDIDRPSFSQELIYNGRVGDTLKFLYREFSSDHIRAPFSQDVQYDLKDGKIIGFKGVRIEVLEATNIRMKYRVLSSFPGSF